MSRVLYYTDDGGKWAESFIIQMMGVNEQSPLYPCPWMTPLPVPHPNPSPNLLPLPILVIFSILFIPCTQLLIPPPINFLRGNICNVDEQLKTLSPNTFVPRTHFLSSLVCTSWRVCRPIERISIWRMHVLSRQFRRQLGVGRLCG